MKNIITSKILFLFIYLLVASTVPAIAQDSPPDPPAGHGGTNDDPGGGAPIGGGVVTLLVLGAAYGTKKYFGSRREDLES